MYDNALLSRARKERKPLHLSIGRYPSSQTSYEMAFYDLTSVGEVLNDTCINVKIDADERPDLERLFTVGYAQFGHSTMFDVSPTTVFIKPPGMHVSQPHRYFMADPYEVGTSQFLYAATEILTKHLADALDKPDAGPQLLSEMQRQGLFKYERGKLPTYEQYFATCLENRQKIINAEANQLISPMQYMMVHVKALLQLWYHSGERTRDDTKGLDIALIALTRWVRDYFYDHVEGGFFTPLPIRRAMGVEMSKRLTVNAWTLDLLMQAVAISRDSLLMEVVRETADFIDQRLAVIGWWICSGFTRSNQLDAVCMGST